MESISQLKEKAECSKGSGMEADQADQLDALLNLTTKVLNKNCDMEGTDSSTTSKRDNRSCHLLIIQTL